MARLLLLFGVNLLFIASDVLIPVIRKIQLYNSQFPDKLKFSSMKFFAKGFRQDPFDPAPWIRHIGLYMIMANKLTVLDIGPSGRIASVQM